jgi:hypothetical protein
MPLRELIDDADGDRESGQAVHVGPRHSRTAATCMTSTWAAMMLLASRVSRTDCPMPNDAISTVCHALASASLLWSFARFISWGVAFG